MTRRKRRLHISRDSLLFIGGMAGITNETLSRHAERPTLIVLFGAMIGLPVFLRSDEGKDRWKDRDDREPEERSHQDEEDASRDR